MLLISTGLADDCVVDAKSELILLSSITWLLFVLLLRIEFNFDIIGMEEEVVLFVENVLVALLLLFVVFVTDDDDDEDEDAVETLLLFPP